MKMGISNAFPWQHVIKSSWFTRGKLFTQHDGRVGISGVSENIINGRHPGLVSGSLLILGMSIMGIVWQNEKTVWKLRFDFLPQSTRRRHGGHGGHFGRVSVPEFLMAKMLKQVQHDGRVGISGFSENIINGRHPGLVSGSLSILAPIWRSRLGDIVLPQSSWRRHGGHGGISMG